MKERKRDSGTVTTGAVHRPRVLVPELAAYRGSSEEIPLRKEERAHVRSRRLRDGDELIALDGKGARACASLTRGGTAIRSLTFEEAPGLSSSFSPSSVFPSLPGEPSLRVTVLLACAEPARVEWAVEKGTECGAAAFVLLVAERSQRAHVAAARARLARLARIAVEATKQCGRTIVPAIGGPEEIENFLRGREGRGEARRAIFVADPSDLPLGRALSSSTSSPPRAGGAVMAIGPEGGFTPPEISLFEEFGALRVSLGPRVLRLETAVVAALTLLVGAR